ncbi:MAG: hypothetical protein COX57_02785 [Alphaproteobacteria bacterium CG_4_10_14_0_2_um_filter_63_37]|nr:MAG: hypothetical protein AUJ55_03255 [Proteobacteria bacterium CG1_02_64_396]PJA25470.1 MAG: hypothetical protein COX57_02785 [Alphaproteobacteria bacterium CG_4_10_14_0_2_um_filter_63_37]
MARVYQTYLQGEAHICIALVNQPGQADLCVRRVGSWGLASGDTLWFITPDKQQANVWLYFGSIGQAQVKVCFVDNYGAVGWNQKNRFKGRFG